LNGGTIDTGRPYCSAAVSESGDTVETKRAAHPFSAIRVRSLNDPRRGSLPTVQTVTLLSTPPRHLHEVQTDISVTIRLLILTPGQRVNRIRAETDVLQRTTLLDTRGRQLQSESSRCATGGCFVTVGNHDPENIHLSSAAVWTILRPRRVETERAGGARRKPAPRTSAHRAPKKAGRSSARAKKASQ
jgi:hypothetical protein